MMIILNLVTGICLLFGGLRHGEQEYNSQGALAVPLLSARGADKVEAVAEAEVPLDKRAMLARSVILVALILPILLLAHDMAVLIDMGVEQAGATMRELEVTALAGSQPL